MDKKSFPTFHHSRPITTTKIINFQSVIKASVDRRGFPTPPARESNTRHIPSIEECPINRSDAANKILKFCLNVSIILLKAKIKIIAAPSADTEKILIERKAFIKMARLLMIPLFLMLCSCAALYQPPKLHEDGGVKVIYEEQIKDWQERVKKEKWSENLVDEIVRTCRVLVKYTADKNPDYRWKDDYWFTPPSHLRNLRIKSAPVRALGNTI